MTKKIFDKDYWKNYTVGFYAGISAGIALVLWQELNIEPIICKILLLALIYFATYFVLGIFGQIVYSSWIKPK